jgi:hypothetical protein
MQEGGILLRRIKPNSQEFADVTQLRVAYKVASPVIRSVDTGDIFAAGGQYWGVFVKDREDLGCVYVAQWDQLIKKYEEVQ